MRDGKLIQTCVMITKAQRDYLQNSSYNSSKLFRNVVISLMKKENPLSRDLSEKNYLPQNKKGAYQ